VPEGPDPDLNPPQHDDGEVGMDDWGEELYDEEIDEEMLRAEWLTNDESNTKRRTKATVLLASCNMKGRGETDHMNRPSANNKWLQINQIMREKKIGILALQETHMTDELDAKIADLFGKRLATIHSRDADAPNTKGVSIVINKELLDTEGLRSTEIVPGRALVADVPWHNNERLIVLAVYAPNRPDQNREFWKTITNEWDTRRLPKPDIMMGDLNFVESFIDRLPAHDDRPDVTEAFNGLKTRLKLADGWRLLNPGARNYTYLQAQTEGQPQSRIDRIYASSKAIRNSQEWDIIPTGGIQTDHWMVTVRILSDQTPYQGPGRWSLPLYLLRDRKLREEINELTTELETEIERCKHRRTAERNPQILYKIYKQKLAEIGRQRAKETTPALKAEIDELMHERKKAANDPRLPPRDRTETVIEITERINEIEESRHTLARTSTAARDALEGERITRYWSAVNAPARKHDPIRNLRRPNGQGLETRSDQMAEIARDHHENIQTEGLEANNEAREDAIRTAHGKIKNKLTNIQKAKMAKKLSESDVRAAIRAAPPGKAAGLDGLPAELWKELATNFSNAEQQDEKPTPMPPNIVKILTCVYNDIEANGIEDGTDFNEGWMCPIFKKNERSNIANYRPITVLNTDYKIMTKALTTKLTSVINDLIDGDQAGFIPKRSIFDQVKLAKLVLKHAETTSTNGAIVALDQEKAYDKIAHDYLWRTLIEFNMPQNFINTVARLYTNAHTSVMINGVLSSTFRITRGVRQGDPLSCLLFNLAIEPLACAIRQSTLKGIIIPGRTERLIVKLFADDTTVYLDSEDDLNELHNMLEGWCRASRAKFNISKTEVIPIGMPGYRLWVTTAKKLHGTHAEVREPMRINRDGEPVRILGAWIGNKIDNAVPWAPVVEKIERTLERWDRSHPSTEGRRLIVQMVIGGTTQYLAKVQEMPDNITKKLTDVLWDFIWAGNARRAPINRETMHAPLLEGGKKILDLEARNEAIQLTWLQSYMTTENRPTWAYFADHLFGLAALPSGRQVDGEAAGNPFLQNWRPKLSAGSTLPNELISMVKAARKHDAKIEALEMGENIRRDMPLWFHIRESTYAKQVTNRPTARCLRTAHEIRNVGHLEANIAHQAAHTGRPSCRCETCSAGRAQGCRNPTQCRDLGTRILASIPEQWHPQKCTENINLTLTEEERQANDTAVTKGEDVTFERSLTVDDTQEAFRVFTSKTPREYSTPTTVIRTEPEREIRTVWAASKSRPSAQDATRTAATIWLGPADAQNVTFIVGGDHVSRQKGEAMAIVEALRTAPPDQPLRVICQSRQAVENLTTKLRYRENKGWITVKHGDIFRKAAAWAKKRRAKTYFKVQKIARSGKPESAIHRTLDQCLADATSDALEMQEAREYEVEGARLQGLTQSELYKHIVERKKKNTSRRRTVETLNRIKTDTSTPGGPPEDEHIWKSVRHRDFSRAQRTFKWRAMHGAYKVGAYWRTIPNYEDRATCPICGEEESIEHILLTCTSPTRRAIKEAEKELWSARTDETFPPDNIGTRLGAGIIHFGTKRGSKEFRGLERFWRIIQSETDQIIWTLRCEARIARGDRPEERHSIVEALNRWRSAIDRRLNLDRITADKKRFGKIATDRELVLETWNEAIEQGDEDGSWIEQGGVLVGRRLRQAQSPPGDG
jgi:exonuclease III